MISVGICAVGICTLYYRQLRYYVYYVAVSKQNMLRVNNKIIVVPCFRVFFDNVEQYGYITKSLFAT